MPDDVVLVRRGKSYESATRLARQAADAEMQGRPHGISVTSPASNNRLAEDPTDFSQAMRSDFENAGFRVHHTRTRRDPDHHTVELPKPVTSDVADLFNQVLY